MAKISGGSVNGPTTFGGKTLKCSCGNTTNWTNMSMSGGKTEATCAPCGAKITN